jgi:hypothetical protein
MAALGGKISQQKLTGNNGNGSSQKGNLQNISLDIIAISPRKIPARPVMEGAATTGDRFLMVLLLPTRIT